MLRGSGHGAIHRFRGFTMIEAVICIVLVGIALVAALQTVGATAKSSTITERRAIGMMLAHDLMSEVLAHPYKDPDGALLGLELGELLSDRTTFDDVDDFNGYTEKPPRDASGSVISGFTDWRRTVAVDLVDPAAPDTVRLLDRGAKRIVVTVYRGDHEVARVRAVRTEAWDPSTMNRDD